MEAQITTLKEQNEAIQAQLAELLLRLDETAAPSAEPTKMPKGSRR
jgi:hypothetical protein